MNRIIIDPILERVCLPPTVDEFNLLESQILRDGCQDALKVWDRDGELVLLDGHNRLKICKKHDKPYDTSTIEISNIDEAIIWIVDNQRGRRNVATKEQQDYISGKRYEAEKNINRFKGNQYTEKSGGIDNMHHQNDDRTPHQSKTILRRAHDEGVSHFKIGQNEKFAQGVDAVREVSPELAEKILKPDPTAPTLTKKAVSALPKLKAANPMKFVETVKAIDEALETKDKKIVEAVVRDHISPNEPTHEEKMIAKKHHLLPEHVQYANENNIPYDNMRTIEQIDAINARKASATCSTTWDGFYGCNCGIKFEMFGSEHAPVCCPHCGKSDGLKRAR
jgi:hypothetical protein